MEHVHLITVEGLEGFSPGKDFFLSQNAATKCFIQQKQAKLL